MFLQKVYQLIKCEELDNNEDSGVKIIVEMLCKLVSKNIIQFTIKLIKVWYLD